MKMNIRHLFNGYLFLSALFFIMAFSCDKGDTIIVPEKGFDWPVVERPYWPTNGWQTALPESRGFSVDKLAKAKEFAEDDYLMRALLVVKEGYLVVEEYYGEGGPEASTNLWSVTKSVTSALLGIAREEGAFSSPDQRMAELLTSYPDFNDITLHHALTHTTGLDWNEEGPRWVEWIFSEDWVQAALDRGQDHPAGKHFHYSSGNSQFLTSLIYYRMGRTPGDLADEKLFQPLGIDFEPLALPPDYSSWNDYKIPVPQSWLQSPKGIETAGFGLFLTARDMAKFGYLYLNRGLWENRYIVPQDWVEHSLKDHKTNIYGRYSYGYHWWLTKVAGEAVFLASGFGGQIIGVVPSLDMVVVLKYEAENPRHPKSGTAHDDMKLFELVVKAAQD